MSGRHRIRWPALALLAFAAIASPCRGAETPAAEQPTDAAKLVDGNTRFACDLYAELRDMKSLDGENIIVSPYSISIALGMTYAGARGKTAKEMAEVLHFNLSQERLHPAFKQLADGLRPSGQDAGYELHTANALWPDRKTTLVPDYLDLTGRYYGTRPRPVDFGKPEEAAGIINTWVEEQTRDKIKDLLKTGDVADATLVLTNAVYFKGEWAAAFDKKHTREAPFIRPGKGSVQVDTMWQSGTFPFADVRRVRVAQFPYGKGDLAMLVMVPPRSTTMDRFEKDLTPETVARYVEALRPQKLNVYLPKFKITTDFSAADTLKDMGMKNAFTPRADFSGIGDVGWISDVIHKAFVEVNEEGTEAAASTAVIMKRGPSRINTFQANHPFVFIIRDTRTGSVLFIGRVMDPRKD